MSQGQQLPDPDPELINAKSLDFAKPKLFFKNIGHYTATSTNIHVRVSFNFTQVFGNQKSHCCHLKPTTGKTQRTL